MFIKAISIKQFRRFKELLISELPDKVKLVILVGPNGSGKSSLFDAFNVWHRIIGGLMQQNAQYDYEYLIRREANSLEVNEKEIQFLVNSVKIDFHQEFLTADEKKKLFYIRSAYRLQADFTTQNLNRMGPIENDPRVARLIDQESTVFNNFQRLVSRTVEKVYSGDFDKFTVPQLRDNLIGTVRSSMSRVFDSLLLKGTGDPLKDGSFYFEKGKSKNFHYKNLSGGEKAAFDLILDMIIKKEVYCNTIYCIDEPENHMNTRLQGRLLGELVDLLPEDSQLWVATHSIGMMRKARDLQIVNPERVAFLDFSEKDFDESVHLKPVIVSRDFWEHHFKIVFDDLANLIAPRSVVLCEGKPKTDGQSSNQKTEFDARCYQEIFKNEYHDVNFLSVGNESDVRNDRLGVKKAIETILSGTIIRRLVDRDDRSTQEIADLEQEGVRVLSKRHLEAYLMDDEVLVRYCETVGKADKSSEVLMAKKLAIVESIARNNAPDDVKSASGKIYIETKRILQVAGVGNTTEAFMRDTLSPLLPSCTIVYTQLKKDVFG